MKNKILILLVSNLVFRCFSEVCKDDGYELYGKNLGPVCYDATNAPKGPYSSMALAARQACNEFSNECSVGKESNVGIYKSSIDGQFYYGLKTWFKNDNSSKHAAPGSAQEYRIGGKSFVKVADMHNHPSKIGDISWFSAIDGEAAEDVDVIMYDCATKDLFRIDHTSKFAYRIDADGKEINVKIPPKECFGAGGGACYWPPLDDESAKSDGNGSVVEGIPFVNSKTKVLGDVNNRGVESKKKVLSKLNRASIADKSTTTGQADKNKRNVKTGSGGIKGWCKCLDKQETCGAKSIEVGAGREWIGKPGYSYRFCLCCGKCRRPPEKFSGADDIKIIDREFYWKVQTAKDDIERNRLIKERLSSVGIKGGDGDTTREAVSAMAVAQIRLMQVPDGQVVIQGECTCKDSDPINSGYVPDEYVCVSCGKHCANQSGKIGKTAKRIMTKGY